MNKNLKGKLFLVGSFLLIGCNDSTVGTGQDWNIADPIPTPKAAPARPGQLPDSPIPPPIQFPPDPMPYLAPSSPVPTPTRTPTPFPTTPTSTMQPTRTPPTFPTAPTSTMTPFYAPTRTASPVPTRTPRSAPVMVDSIPTATESTTLPPAPATTPPTVPVLTESASDTPAPPVPHNDSLSPPLETENEESRLQAGLPVEVQDRIGGYLSRSELRTLSQTSHHFYELVRDTIGPLREKQEWLNIIQSSEFSADRVHAILQFAGSAIEKSPSEWRIISRAALQDSISPVLLEVLSVFQEAPREIRLATYAKIAELNTNSSIRALDALGAEITAEDMEYVEPMNRISRDPVFSETIRLSALGILRGLFPPADSEIKAESLQILNDSGSSHILRMDALKRLKPFVQEPDINQVVLLVLKEDSHLNVRKEVLNTIAILPDKAKKVVYVSLLNSEQDTELRILALNFLRGRVTLDDVDLLETLRRRVNDFHEDEGVILGCRIILKDLQPFSLEEMKSEVFGILRDRSSLASMRYAINRVKRFVEDPQINQELLRVLKEHQSYESHHVRKHVLSAFLKSFRQTKMKALKQVVDREAHPDLLLTALIALEKVATPDDTMLIPGLRRLANNLPGGRDGVYRKISLRAKVLLNKIALQAR